MNKTRIILLTLLIASTLFLAGCGSKKTVDMNQLSEDKTYHYINKDLGFSINLPKEFQYYQTQRKNNADYTDLEFFIPTSDTGFAQEVPGYAKPVTIRIISKKVWEATDNKFDKTLVKEIGQKDDTVYAVIFWDTIPKDWQTKWSDDMQKQIINNFKIL
jgi:hypothetical protein